MLVFCTLAHAQPVLKKTSGSLGTGTTWQTDWFVTESGVAGPTVLIVGGVHGNEPAGAQAAEQIRHWPITSGKLIVIPQVNRLGLAGNIRWSPDHRNDRKTQDLNRNFPAADRPLPQTDHCRALWEFVSEHRPDWVFDLHEGFDFHRLNAKSVGSSVISFPEQAEFAGLLQAAVNETVDADRQFDLLAGAGPAEGSLARACHEQFLAKSFILETTFKNQPVSMRARQHRRMVATAFRQIGIVQEDLVDRIGPDPSDSVTRVGVFDDQGANETQLKKVIDNRPELFVTVIGSGDIKPEILDQLDVLMFPGGSGSAQGTAIGATGRESIRQFVRDGGGVVGICAGAYLCTSHYEWSLGLFNASVFNRMVDVPGKGPKSMWYRGPGTQVDVEATGAGLQILGIEGVHSIRYANGPILSPGNQPALPDYQPLAHFRSENGIYEAQKNTMVGTPAVVESKFGKGRVLAISPHFESTPGQGSVILRAVEHVRAHPGQEQSPDSGSTEIIKTRFAATDGEWLDAKIVLPPEKERNGYGILMLVGGYGNDLDWSSPGYVEDQGNRIPITLSGKVHADAPAIARSLVRQGFVVMHWGTFQPRDASADVWPNQPTGHSIGDLIRFSKSALGHFRSLQLIPDDQVILLGHSLGAVRAANIAADDSGIAGLVLLAPAQLTRTAADDPGKNCNRQLAREFMGIADIDGNGTCSRPEFSQWEETKPVANHPLAGQPFRQLDFFADDQLCEWEVSAGFARHNRSQAGFREAAKQDSSGMRWTEDLLREKPIETLIVYGVLDSSQAHHAPVISELIRSEKLDHLTVRVVPDVGHQLGPVENGLVGPISQESLGVVSDWLGNLILRNGTR